MPSPQRPLAFEKLDSPTTTGSSRNRTSRTLFAYALPALLLGTTLCVSPSAKAQYVAPALQPGSEDHRFSFGFGPGLIWNVTKLDAYGASFTAQVGYAINENWAVAVAPTWDVEIRHKNGKTTAVNTLGTAFTPVYSFNRHWSLAAGYQISFANDGGGDWKLKSEHSVGVAPAYTGSLGRRWLWTLGPTFGYDISADEFSITLDLIFGFNF